MEEINLIDAHYTCVKISQGTYYLVQLSDNKILSVSLSLSLFLSLCVCVSLWVFAPVFWKYKIQRFYCMFAYFKKKKEREMM